MKTGDGARRSQHEIHLTTIQLYELQKQKGRLMWNVIIGLLFVGGGLSGHLTLRGTDSGPALAILGGVLVLWGIVQVVRARSGE
jgi:hypothetical protein